jgi:hypothetical protein
MAKRRGKVVRLAAKAYLISWLGWRMSRVADVCCDTEGKQQMISKIQLARPEYSLMVYGGIVYLLSRAKSAVEDVTCTSTYLQPALNLTQALTACTSAPVLILPLPQFHGAGKAERMVRYIILGADFFVNSNTNPT